MEPKKTSASGSPSTPFPRDDQFLTNTDGASEYIDVARRKLGVAGKFPI
jgi:hypothetical protein